MFNIGIHFIRMGTQGAKNRYEGLANHQKGIRKATPKSITAFRGPRFFLPKEFSLYSVAHIHII